MRPYVGNGTVDLEMISERPRQIKMPDIVIPGTVLAIRGQVTFRLFLVENEGKIILLAVSRFPDVASTGKITEAIGFADHQPL